jgi:NitT/TauT family transport system substrate-binding protein
MSLHIRQIKLQSFFRRCVGIMLAFLLTHAARSAPAYFDAYDLSPASAALHIGVQPLGIPSGVISGVMVRDRILQKALAQAGHPFKTHAFQRGADMVGLLAQKRLKGGLLGDMPTLLSTAAGNTWVVALVKQSSTAIVANGVTQVRGLVGKRIGYTELSSAHHTLLQGLASAGIQESQVSLVPMRVDQMPDALAHGDIDAFAAWEPAPSVALARSDANRIVFRGLSSDYFVLERDFVRQQPEAALYVTAGFLRAIEWMQRSQRNVEKAASWLLADGQAFWGQPPSVSIAQVVAITRRDILDIPSAPAIPLSADNFPLRNEFLFLNKLGKLPAGAVWENVQTAFKYDGLARVLGDPRKYQITRFDYDD